MMRGLRGNRGFTLIELMIVVAIIALLAAIAIPNFTAMQLRSKRSELPTNVDAIRTAELAYQHEWDLFTSCEANPEVLPVKDQVAFGQSYGDNSDWDLLGWMADGFVRGQYSVEDLNPVFATGLGDEGSIAEGLESSSSLDFEAHAIADIDGDGTTAEYLGTRSAKATMVSFNNVY